MNRNGVSLYDVELRAVLRRLDLDGDGKVNFFEFRKLFDLFLSYASSFRKKEDLGFSGSASKFSNTYYSSQASYSPYKRPNYKKYDFSTYSPLRSNRYLSPNRNYRDTSSLFNRTSPQVSKSPIRNSPLRSSPLRGSPIRGVQQRELNYSSRSPERSFQQRLSPMRTNQSRYSPERVYSKVYPSYEEECFQKHFKDIVEMERDLESAKIDLTLRTDFNISDMFRAFELDNRGFLTESDLQYTLEQLGIFQPIEEFALLIKRFSPLRMSTLR